MAPLKFSTSELVPSVVKPPPPPPPLPPPPPPSCAAPLSFRPFISPFTRSCGLALSAGTPRLRALVSREGSLSNSPRTPPPLPPRPPLPPPPLPSPPPPPPRKELLVACDTRVGGVDIGLSLSLSLPLSGPETLLPARPLPGFGKSRWSDGLC